MNEDFNMDELHEVDRLFRDNLENYTEVPSDAAWGKLNRKLNAKEVHDFVTFKKPPAKSSSWPTPVYRMQWFRGLVAGTVGAALIVSSVLVVNSLKKENESAIQTLSDSNSIPSQNVRPGEQNNLQKTVVPENTVEPQITPDGTQPGNTPVNVKPETLFNKAYNPVQSAVKDIERVETSNNQTLADQMNAAKKNLPEQLELSDQQAVANNYERYHEASQVDSLIHQAVIADSLRQSRDEMNPAVDENTEGEVTAYNPDQPGEDDDMKPVVANGFTPNGDGLNEYFYIHNLEKYPDNVLLIQDRKGTIVLDKKNYTGDWNAAGVPDGTYFYLFTYKDELGQKQSIQGVVYIIR